MAQQKLKRSWGTQQNTNTGELQKEQGIGKSYQESDDNFRQSAIADEEAESRHGSQKGLLIKPRNLDENELAAKLYRGDRTEKNAYLSRGIRSPKQPGKIQSGKKFTSGSPTACSKQTRTTH